MHLRSLHSVDVEKLRLTSVQALNSIHIRKCLRDVPLEKLEAYRAEKVTEKHHQ